MKTPLPPSASTPERPNHDGRIFGENGEPDTFFVGHFWPKLAFFIFSVGMLGIGLWDLYAPMSRALFGETTEARVVRIVRESPGEPAELIRVRREIKEGDYAYETIFRHFVEVIDKNNNLKVLEMAVASRQTPYALVNEHFRVAYFVEDDYAFALFHHRTWAFGTALSLMGLTFVCLSWFLLSMVGKSIVIDPEDPAQLELERKAGATA